MLNWIPLKYPNLAPAALVAVWALATFCYGAVEPWAMIPAAALLALLALKTPAARRAWIALPVIGVIYLIPLPNGVLALLSPMQAAIGLPWGRLAVDTQMLLLETAKLTAYLAAGVVAYRSIRDGVNFSRLAWGIIFTSAAFSLYGLIALITGDSQLLFWGKRLDTQSVTGTFVNRSHFAGMLELSIPLAFAMLWTQIRPLQARALVRREKTRAAVLMALSILFLVCLILSRSRAGIGCAILSWTIFAIAIRRAFFWRLVAVVIAVALIGSIWIGIGPLIERLDAADFAQGVHRVAIWKATISLISHHPLFGVGPGCYAGGFPPYKPDGTTVDFTHPHNEYLAVAAEFGVPLLMILLWIAYGAGRRLFDLAMDASKYERTYAAGVLAAASAILLHSLFDFNLRIPANGILFSIVVGAGLALCPVADRKTPRWVVVPALLAVLVALIPFSKEPEDVVKRSPLNFDAHLALAAKAYEAKHFVTFERELILAETCGPNQTDLRTRAGILWFEYSKSQPKYRAKALESFRVAASLQPDPPTLMKIYGLLIGAGDQNLSSITPPRHARVLGELLIQLNERGKLVPDILRLGASDDDLVELGRRAYHVGWYAESIELLRKCKPSFTAHLYLGKSWEALDELTQARMHYELALKDRPAGAEGWYTIGRLNLKEGRADDAEKAFRTSLSANPDYRDALLELGKMGRDIDLVANYERLLDQSLDRPVLIRLAELLISIGRKDRARSWLEKYLAVYPTDGDVLRLLRECD